MCLAICILFSMLFIPIKGTKEFSFPPLDQMTVQCWWAQVKFWTCYETWRLSGWKTYGRLPSWFLHSLLIYEQMLCTFRSMSDLMVDVCVWFLEQTRFLLILQKAVLCLTSRMEVHTACYNHVVVVYIRQCCAWEKLSQGLMNWSLAWHCFILPIYS